MHDDIKAVLDGSKQWAVVCGDNQEVLATLPADAFDHIITDPPYTEHVHKNLRGDNQEVLATLPADAFDHIITDPPYTEHVHKNLRSANTTSRIICKKVTANFDHLQTIPDIRQYCALSKRWVLAFCALEQLGDYRAACADLWIRSGIYKKKRAVPQFSGDRPGNCCEGIAIFHRKGRKKWNGKGTHAYWEAMPEARKKTGHPAAKPQELLVQLLKKFTDPGDLILDPWFGSGSLGVACLTLGRRFVGVEIDEAHIATSLSRIAKATAQLPLFGG